MSARQTPGNRERNPLPTIYRKHFAADRRERMFLASVSFLATFAAARLVTHGIRDHVGPFRNFNGPGGTHIHHAVFGILGLLGVGYLWNAQIGTGENQPRAVRATSLAFGAASALTLDEFALWLNLQDVYWLPKGRESIDAVVLFGSLLSAATWGAAFLREVGPELKRFHRLGSPHGRTGA